MILNKHHKKSSSTSNLKQERFNELQNLEKNVLLKSDLESIKDLNKILLNEFKCNCCFDIIENPISLTCGHTSCEIW